MTQNKYYHIIVPKEIYNSIEPRERKVEIMDFLRYKKNNKMYAGAERKIGITINGEDYIVKFQKHTRFGLRNNHVSEYLGCKIFESLDIPVQEVYLGTYNNENVVVIKDFVKNNQNFVPFNDVGESSIEEDREKFQYTYEDIIEILKTNNKLNDPDETINMFWTLYIVDAIIGNFDRHGGNWGFLKENNVYSLAPIFDNGSSLFPNLIDEEDMMKIILDEEETNQRVFHFPTSQILLNGKKSSYFEVISSLDYPKCNEALKKIYCKFNMDTINNIIVQTKYISDIQKRFYNHIIKERFNKIIKFSYDKLVEKDERK